MEINKPVATLILLVINLILVFLFAFPKYQEAMALQAKLSQKQAELNSAAAYYENLAKALEGINEREVAIEKINSALPASFSIAQAAGFLQEKSAENGLILKALTFSQLASATPVNQPAGQTKGIKKVALNISLLGNYQGLKNFVSATEKSARLFEIDSITFNSASSQGIVRAQNKFQAYEFRLKLTANTY